MQTLQKMQVNSHQENMGGIQRTDLTETGNSKQHWQIGLHARPLFTSQLEINESFVALIEFFNQSRRFLGIISYQE